MRHYPPDFYQAQQAGATRSAEHIVPLVFDLLQPHSVVDVGCGTGAWLGVFQKMGVQDVVGLDGAAVPQELLLIPPEYFQVIDLSQDFRLSRTFDLVISLEVAEHLPPEQALTFVESLSRLGSVVLFSAAIPFQGGHEHLNERWPQYWAECFQQFGFVGIDCLRPALWNQRGIEWWYRQNIFFFVRQDKLSQYPFLEQAYEPTGTLLGVVHPERYMHLIDQFMYALEQLKAVEQRQQELEQAFKNFPLSPGT